METNAYNAPWGRPLRFMSGLCVALGFIVPAAVWFTDKNGANWPKAGCIYWAIMFGAALFVVRSYTIGPNELSIRRLFWTTRLPLSGLQSAEVRPDAMRGSLRLFGNGGMFSITGLYRNRVLGNYRAFVTDGKLTVVLKFSRRTVVVSPENPERFVSEISQFAFRTS